MILECPNITRKANERSVMDIVRSELWKESVRRYNARRREEMRAEWCEHHQGQAVRLRAVLEELIADHEEQAEKYLPKGA
jgi:hypothetical protein